MFPHYYVCNFTVKNTAANHVLVNRILVPSKYMVPAWHSAVTECFCTALVFSSQ